jgi:hypothetical protein
MPEQSPAEWQAEHELRQGEHDLHKREVEVSEGEHDLHKREVDLHKREVEDKRKWFAMISVAVSAAVVAAFGNLIVTFLNTHETRSLEEYKAEAARILEVIKPGNTSKDQPATYLEFLIDTGLIDPDRRKEIQIYLDRSKAGQRSAIPGRPPVSPEIRITNLRQRVRENSTLTQQERESLDDLLSAKQQERTATENLLSALEAFLSELEERRDRR